MTIALRLLRLTLPGETRGLLLGTLLIVLATMVGLLQPWPLKLVIDSVVGGSPAPWPLVSGSVWTRLWLLCAAIVLLELVTAILTALSTRILVRMGLRLVFKLRSIVFEHVQKLSLAFHEATSLGDSLYRVTWDSYAPQTLVTSVIVPALTALVTLFGIGAIMLTRDWTLTLAAVAVGVPLLVLIRGLDRPLTAQSLEFHARESDVSTRVEETLAGIRAVQAFNREADEHARFRHTAEHSLHANLRLTMLQTSAHALISLLLAGGTAAVVGIAARRALDGRFTVGDVVLVAGYVAMLYKPLEALAYAAVAAQGAIGSARRVFAVLDAVPDVRDAPDAVAFPRRADGHIVFERVWFSYGGDEPALRDISLDIRPGETVALVGISGAGKSTLASLLLRFYDPTGGRITLDGHDLRGVTLRSLREQVAVVLQEPVLFAATVHENIAYGRPGATRADIEAAARAAGAHEFIAALPGGYDTRLGERGVTLSGGERQRLAIARAFVKDAPVLVLDEPTSALDAESERVLVDALQQLMRHRTTFIIAHRLSTIRRADRIAVLRDGALVEIGTHGDLLAQDAAYARLHALQFGPAPLEHR